MLWRESIGFVRWRGLDIRDRVPVIVWHSDQKYCKVFSRVLYAPTKAKKKQQRS